MTTPFDAFDHGLASSSEPVPAGATDDREHTEDDLDEQLCDRATERDLCRIVTHRLMPPPSDTEAPFWSEAWTHFGRIYEPALRVYVSRLLSRIGDGRRPWVHAEDIVQDFIRKRLQDGLLQSKAGKIKRFRAWLTTQVKRHTFDWLRALGAQRRRPEKGFLPVEALDRVPSPEPAPDALIAYREEIAFEITQLVLERVARHSGHYARIIRDLIANGGRQSPELASELGVKPHRMADLRRRARDCFRHELVRVFREDLVPEEEISDLINALKRLYGGKLPGGAK